MDKCFCHLNGYRVKDAEARDRIEVLEDKIENIEIPEGALDSGYHVLNLPLGAPVTEIPFGEVTFDLPTECNGILEEFINKVYKSNIKKPLLKVVNSSYAEGEYPMPVEINYSNTSTEITHEQPTFLFFGFTLQLENMLWRSKLTVNGSWNDFEGDGNYIYVVNSCSMKLIEEVEGGDVDLTGYATEEYVNNAIANIDIPEGEGGSYPIYHIYAPVSMGSSTTLQEDNALCLRLGEVFDDCTTNGFETALILVDAYSQTYILSFKNNGLRSKTNNSFILTATKINGDTSTIDTTDFNVYFNILNNKFKISKIILRPYTINVASKEYVDDSVIATTDLSSTITVPDGVTTSKKVYKKNGSTHCISLSLTGSITSDTKVLTFNNSLVGSSIPHNIPLTYSTDHNGTAKYDGYAYINASELSWSMYVHLPDDVTATNVRVSLTWID